MNVEAIFVLHPYSFVCGNSLIMITNKYGVSKGTLEGKFLG